MFCLVREKQVNGFSLSCKDYLSKIGWKYIKLFIDLLFRESKNYYKTLLMEYTITTATNLWI